mgnify:CR=1 FL=1
MEETKNRLQYHMIKTDEELIKLADRLCNLEGSSMNFKFDIDKLQSKTNAHNDTIRSN